jgi:hypothetical protein
MTTAKRATVECGTHGTRTAAVVCGHMLVSTDRVLGFVENSSKPDDLQAWCDDCEAMFEQEQELTDAFRRFNDMAVVCDFCYAKFRARHSKL